MNDISLLDFLTVYGVALQIANFNSDLSQASNSDIEKHLHEQDNGSGLFEITNRGNLPMAVEVEFNGNVTASTIGAVALSIKQNGEPISGTEMDYTAATANVYQNVGATTLIAVPAGSSVTISVGNVGTVDTLVKDANIIIKKLS